MNKEYWTAADCAKAWGVEPLTARRLMKRCAGWEWRLDERNVRIVTVPPGTPKPARGKSGPKPKEKRLD